MHGRTRHIRLLVSLALLVIPFAEATPAWAADQIYYAGYRAVDRMPVDPPRRFDEVVGIAPTSIAGIAADPAEGKLYFLGHSGEGGVFGGQLRAGGWGPTLLAQTGFYDLGGLAVDPERNLAYFAAGAEIRAVGTDGGVPSLVADVGSARVGGMTIDVERQRLFWADCDTDAIKVVRLAAPAAQPEQIYKPAQLGEFVNNPFGNVIEESFNPCRHRGLAYDATHDRLVWAGSPDRLLTAPANGDGPVEALYSGASGGVLNPFAVAIDPDAGKVFWMNGGIPGESHPLQALAQEAPLDGGGPVRTLFYGAGTDMLILRSPRPAGAPTISGGGEVGGLLRCTGGEWAGDSPGGFVYRAPSAVRYRWLRDGSLLDGSERSYLATAAGEYRCLVEAQNEAGSANQVSNAKTVTGPREDLGAAAPVGPGQPEAQPELDQPPSTGPRAQSQESRRCRRSRAARRRTARELRVISVKLSHARSKRAKRRYKAERKRLRVQFRALTAREARHCS